MSKRNNVMVPQWITQIVLIPMGEPMSDFVQYSDGITAYGQGTIVRHRSGAYESDGARWSRPFVTGKHVFDITWPADCRGSRATVGISRESAPLFTKGSKSLVGMTSSSYGFDLVRRRIIHKGEVIGKCYPKSGEAAPDNFLVYLNMDEGILSFGVDGDYWGKAVNDLNVRNRNEPWYLMVGCSSPNAQVTVRYRGQAPSGPINPLANSYATGFYPVLPGHDGEKPPMYQPNGAAFIQEPVFLDHKPTIAQPPLGAEGGYHQNGTSDEALVGATAAPEKIRPDNTTSVNASDKKEKVPLSKEDEARNLPPPSADGSASSFSEPPPYTKY